MLEKMETDERCVEEKCKDAQNIPFTSTIASLLSRALLVEKEEVVPQVPWVETCPMER